VPGPAITLANTDTTLNIHVRNVGLAEPVSIVIPGQNATTMTPVMQGDRVRSFTHETPAGSIGTYSWTSVKPGTFAYQSGTHPAVQIQMGLYGALTKTAATGEAYGPSTAFNSEMTVLYSEIDTVLHSQVADGTYGTPAGMTSTMGYNPQYFLVNGDDSSTGTPIAGAPGQTSLIRFINMGLKSHIPTVHGDDFAIIAEDGYAYQNPRNQYSVLVAAGQTRDVLFTPTSVGNYPMFDRVLNLTNKTAPTIVTAAAGESALTSPGSLVTILQVGTNADTDNLLDHLDNCLLAVNPGQIDVDNDGFGNACDADLNNDGFVNTLDIPLFITAFLARSQLVDFNEDGAVNTLDIPKLVDLLFKEPGPSGTVN
jgi:FtsP/CotA-like multicopper oxidase with cupredoxin domain